MKFKLSFAFVILGSIFLIVTSSKTTPLWLVLSLSGVIGLLGMVLMFLLADERRQDYWKSGENQTRKVVREEIDRALKEKVPKSASDPALQSDPSDEAAYSLTCPECGASGWKYCDGGEKWYPPS